MARVLRLALLALALAATVGATAADLNEAGKAAYSRGDFATAERLFSQAIVQAPQEPLLHYHRAVALTRLGRWQEARASYETALRLNPSPDVAAVAREGLRSVAPMARGPAPSTSAGGDATVRLRHVSGGWLANVVLNESRRAVFLVDTGASVCIISPSLAKELGLEPERLALLQTLSGPTGGPVVKIPSIRVGDAEAEGVVAVVHATGPLMDGILGNSFLSRFTVTLDPRQGVLQLGPR